MKKIITTPDPRLRQKSTKVKPGDETSQIIADMVELSHAWEKEHPYELSAAMAAPQMGVNKRIIIVRDDFNEKKNDTFTALLNPEVIKAEGKTVVDQEGCLSVPFLYGDVPRKDRVKIKAELEDGTEVRIKADSYLARTLQHEIDHLNGILFIDHIKDCEDAFYKIDDDGELQPISPEKYAKEIKGNRELWGEDD